MEYDNRIDINSEFPRKIGVLITTLGKTGDIIDTEIEKPRLTSHTYGKSMLAEDDLQKRAEELTESTIERLEEIKNEVDEHIDYFKEELQKLKEDKPLAEGQQQFNLD